MIIKTADDKTKRLTLLEDLKASPLLDARQKDWLRQELLRTQRGLQGERDAAHYIDARFKDSEAHAVLHDLRFEVEGEVAQIDHMVITRALCIYLFETKCFAGNVKINERGEFTVTYPGERAFGVPSPLEQSRRHERLLLKVLARLEISGRLGIQPQFVHAVLLHPKAIITRPDAKAFNTDDVIKADHIATWHKAMAERSISMFETLSLAVNMRGSDTLKALAEKLARQHRPINPLNLPDFMAPKAKPARSRPAAVPVATVAQASAVERQPTRPAPPLAPEPSAAPAPTPTIPAATTTPPEHLRRKLICVACNAKISFAEGKFCWGNEARFGGLQYCRAHQQTQGAAP